VVVATPMFRNGRSKTNGCPVPNDGTGRYRTNCNVNLKEPTKRRPRKRCPPKKKKQAAATSSTATATSNATAGVLKTAATISKATSDANNMGRV